MKRILPSLCLALLALLLGAAVVMEYVKSKETCYKKEYETIECDYTLCTLSGKRIYLDFLPENTIRWGNLKGTYRYLTTKNVVVTEAAGTEISLDFNYYVISSDNELNGKELVVEIPKSDYPDSVYARFNGAEYKISMHDQEQKRISK